MERKGTAASTGIVVRPKAIRPVDMSTTSPSPSKPSSTSPTKESPVSESHAELLRLSRLCPFSLEHLCNIPSDEDARIRELLLAEMEIRNRRCSFSGFGPAAPLVSVRNETRLEKCGGRNSFPKCGSIPERPSNPMARDRRFVEFGDLREQVTQGTQRIHTAVH